jgi:hypothetical protein
MLARQKKLIQDTWTQVVPIADQAAAIFYQRLFEIDPSTRALFNIHRYGAAAQKAHADPVGGGVELDNLGALGKTVEDLGRRHAGLASRTRITTRSVWRCSGPWSRGLVQHGRRSGRSWKEVYGLLSGIMRNAQQTASAKRLA